MALGIAGSIAFAVSSMKSKGEDMHSGSMRLLVVQRIEEDTTGVTILFQTGLKGRLSRKRKNFQSYITLARRSAERHFPAGISMDGSGEIGEIAKADNDVVAFLEEGPENRVKIGFQGHDGIAYLERQNPHFDRMERELIRSLKEKKRIWFVWRLPRLMLEDVMIVEEDISAIPLTEQGALPAEFRAAAEAAAGYLKAKGEEPSEFYVGDISRGHKAIVLPLWHLSAFALEQRHRGNPGGRCRDLEYDTATGRITRESFWQ